MVYSVKSADNRSMRSVSDLYGFSGSVSDGVCQQTRQGADQRVDIVEHLISRVRKAG